MNNKDILALRLRIRELEKQNEGYAKILINMQPVIGRLIATSVVLELKGIINNDELNKVQEQQAETYVASANKAVAGKVPSEPG